MEAKKKLAKKNLAAKSASKSARRAADVVDPSKIVRELGDHINTRFGGPADMDDLDEDLHGAELINEAKLLSGDRARQVAGDVKKFITASSGPAAGASAKVIGHNRNAVTCVGLYKSLVVYGDKAGSVVVADFLSATFAKWVLAPQVPGGVFAIAVSDTPLHAGHNMGLERSTVDASVVSYTAAGGGDGAIYIWNTLTRALIGTLQMHRTAVTGLVFRTRSATLLSCSADSTLRVWSVPEMHAVDKFFGHLGKVTAVAALRKERAATVGEDGSTRYWKLEAATQMEFLRADTSAEAVGLLTDQTVVCGTLDGALRLFDINKRSAIASVERAHGSGVLGDGTGLEAEAVAVAQQEGRTLRSSEPNAISALVAAPFGDLVATGSCSGAVKLWRAEGFRSDGGKSQPALEALGELPCVGFVNGLALSEDFGFVVAAVAKEPRLGRWRTLSSAMNSVVVFPLSAAARQKLVQSGSVGPSPAAAATAAAVRQPLASKGATAAGQHVKGATAAGQHVKASPRGTSGFVSDGGANDNAAAEEKVNRLGHLVLQAIFDGGAANELQIGLPKQRGFVDEAADGGANDDDAELPAAQTSAFTVQSDGRLIFNTPAAGATGAVVKGKRKMKGKSVPLATKREFFAAKAKKVVVSRVKKA